MSFALRITSMVVIGFTMVLAGCESTPTSADAIVTATETAPVQSPDPLNALSIRLPQTSYLLQGNALSNPSTGRSMRVPVPLIEQLHDVADATQFRNELREQMASDTRIQAMVAKHRVPNLLASRQMAERLTARDPGTNSGAAPMLMASSTSYTCNDVAIAIYDQTLLLDQAFEKFDEKLSNMLTSGDIPSYGDVATLGVLAFDVKLWHTSLNILATVYAISGCWDS